MVRLVLLASAAWSTAVLAPIPREERLPGTGAGYGVRYDPAQRGTFDLTADRLRVGVSALAAGPPYPPPAPATDAPRAWREVTGDFTATVRVSFPIRPRKWYGESRLGIAGAGLIAADGGREHVTLSRTQRTGVCPDKGDVDSEWVEQHHGTGQPFTPFQIGAAPDPAGTPLRLRLRRVGDRVTGSYSRDGSTWTEFSTNAVGFGQTVWVGVVAHNIYLSDFEATFDEYTLTHPDE